ncbi:hypothetical protein [Actinotalea sp.]|uniref:hypothetical protein n=1 Tax=Actinotalea sp. TaxID=1872145 RepID=UPI0035695177
MTISADQRVARSRRTPLLVAAAGLAVLGGAGLVAADLLAGSSSAESIELMLPADGGAASICLAFTVEDLARMSPAFAGTVTDLTDEGAVLRVDRWYAGPEASEVTVSVPDGAQIALNGTIDFQVGRAYLITGEGGLVNLCGYSGELTPELQAAFEAAF